MKIDVHTSNKTKTHQKKDVNVYRQLTVVG